MYTEILITSRQTEHPALYTKAHASCRKVGGVKEVRTSASTVAQTVTLPTFILVVTCLNFDQVTKYPERCFP